MWWFLLSRGASRHRLAMDAIVHRRQAPSWDWFRLRPSSRPNLCAETHLATQAPALQYIARSTARRRQSRSDSESCLLRSLRALAGASLALPVLQSQESFAPAQAECPTSRDRQRQPRLFGLPAEMPSEVLRTAIRRACQMRLQNVQPEFGLTPH